MKFTLAVLLAALSFQAQAVVIVRPIIVVRPAPRISALPPPKPATAQPKPVAPAESAAKTEVINRPVPVINQPAVVLHPVIIQSSNCTNEKKKQGQGCR